MMRISYKWKLVIILWLAFFFNQADRQIFNVVLSEIRDDLGLTDAHMGLISTSFLIVYGLLVPVAGVAGDYFSKKKVIIVSLIVWTTATLFTGFSTTLVHFILLRCLAMGGGEAFYSPSANALIGESHKKTISTALSIHQTALYFGVIMSSYMTGLIAQSYGWRAPFFVFGVAGLILAVVIYWQVQDTSKTKKANDHSDGDDEQDDPIVQAKFSKKLLLAFFKKPTAVLLALAFAGMQFVGMGFMTWMPTLLHENYNLNLSNAGFNSTFYYKAAALVAIIVGARITDHFARKNSGARLLIQSLGLLIGVPALFIMGDTSDLKIVYVAMLVYGICQGLYDSNIFASLYEVIEPSFRATATGIMLSFAFVVGAFAPLILGVVKPYIGLTGGISLLSIILFLSSLCIVIAYKFYLNRDKVDTVKLD